MDAWITAGRLNARQIHHFDIVQNDRTYSYKASLLIFSAVLLIKDAFLSSELQSAGERLDIEVIQNDIYIYIYTTSTSASWYVSVELVVK